MENWLISLLIPNSLIISYKILDSEKADILQGEVDADYVKGVIKKLLSEKLRYEGISVEDVEVVSADAIKLSSSWLVIIRIPNSLVAFFKETYSEKGFDHNSAVEVFKELLAEKFEQEGVSPRHTCLIR